MNDADKSLAGRLIQALGRSYTVEGELGRGGMGVVYKARDERLKRQVAIKVLPPELAFREEIRIRFLREAETAARLSHPHIVPIHSVGEGPDGLVYFVMAYVDGESLAARLKRRGRLPAEEAPRVVAKRPDCPPDLESCVMRCLEKNPEARWPTADALRRSLGARTATAYQPRRPPAAGTRRYSGAPPLPAPPGPPAQRGRERDRRPSRRGRVEHPVPLGEAGEAAIVREARASFVRWASVSGSLLLVDVLTGHHVPSWSLMVAGFMAAFGLVPRYIRLWHAGYSWRDVLYRPSAPDAADVRLGLATGAKPAELPPATSGEFGRQTGAVQQARNDRKAILKIFERVPKSEKKLLPDVVHTVDALLHRAEELARMLHTMSADVDQSALARLDGKIAATKQEREGPERERQLGLLARQRQTLTDLVTRRQLIEDQIESCVLAMQNVRFDLLRLRSAGVAAVLDDLTQATQQARALSRDVDHAIAAAGEIREALGERPRA